MLKSFIYLIDEFNVLHICYNLKHFNTLFFKQCSIEKSDSNKILINFLYISILMFCFLGRKDCYENKILK